MAEFSKDVLSDNSPAWKRLHEAAVLELDNSKLPERIAEARRAIYDRAEETLAYSLLAEHRLLNNALHTFCRYLRHCCQRETAATVITRCDDWLDPGVRAVDAASDLLNPYDARLMRSYPVSSRVNSVVNDDEGARSQWNLPRLILAADFRSLTPEGRLFNKSDALADAHKRSTMHFPYHVEHADLRMFQFGDAAVVTYSKEFIGTEGEVKGKVRKQGFY